MHIHFCLFYPQSSFPRPGVREEKWGLASMAWETEDNDGTGVRHVENALTSAKRNRVAVLEGWRPCSGLLCEQSASLLHLWTASVTSVQVHLS